MDHSTTSAVDPNTLRAGYEPIRGYRLETQIGRGGFGEVWRVNAPGDLKKAIKFVFGHHGDLRAARELRSLERIRAIRHPFLLTLERFEVVNDRLVIVTELADGSLEDIYKRHRGAGSCGIPRTTLLKYLSDTADGLDYLHQKFGLQHLDVKPANLLMVGGHVKVADFGLLKDLGDVDCSVVGGLTPIYAPPELFDGRPSLHSDQYSLAVLYQEMLTGTRPFAGRTIAQLATQHVHSTPNLEPLPPRDRSVVARALEKDPDRRFSSCEELFEELSHSSKTSSSLAGHCVAVEKPVVGDLPEIVDQAKTDDSARTRMVVVALGGTGADCLASLQRIALANCTETTIDAVAIDVDLKSSYHLKVEAPYRKHFRFRNVHTPLRTAKEYRRDASSRFGSISRRWIYNVPKDGQTQSMRTIGRLAMVDHGPQITKALKDAIAAASETDGNENLHVYVVGSIGGGTGSGMYIDVVHQLRYLLDQSGLQNVSIVSLMSCQTFGGEDSTGLAYHNTHAALIEINHFLKPENGYPGDSGAGFHPVPAARTPLRNLYLLPGNANAKFGCRPVETIVNYLWNASHEAAAILRDSRQGSVDDSNAPQQTTLRSVGIVSIGQSKMGYHQRLTTSLIAELLSGWLGTPKDASSAAAALVRRIGRRSGMTADYVFGSIMKTLSIPEQPGTIDPARLIASPTDGAMDYVATSIGNQIMREVSHALSDQNNNLSVLIAVIGGLEDLGHSLLDQWTNQIGGEYEKRGPREIDRLIAIGKYVFAQIISRCEEILQRLECLAAIIAVATVELHRSEKGEDPWSLLPDELQNQRLSLIEKAHQVSVNTFLIRPLNNLNSNLTAEDLTERLAEAVEPQLVALIQELSDKMDMGNAGRSEDDSTTNIGRTERIDQSLSRSMDLSTNTASFATPTLQAADPKLPQSPETIEDAIAMVRPPLIDFGGEQRMILLVPTQSQRLKLESILRAQHQGSISVAIREGIATTLVQEMRGIPMKSLIARMEVIGGDSQITKRLSSRIDVEWSEPNA